MGRSSRIRSFLHDSWRKAWGAVNGQSPRHSWGGEAALCATLVSYPRVLACLPQPTASSARTAPDGAVTGCHCWLWRRRWMMGRLRGEGAGGLGSLHRLWFCANLRQPWKQTPDGEEVKRTQRISAEARTGVLPHEAVRSQRPRPRPRCCHRRRPHARTHHSGPRAQPGQTHRHGLLLRTAQAGKEGRRSAARPVGGALTKGQGTVPSSVWTLSTPPPSVRAVPGAGCQRGPGTHKPHPEHTQPKRYCGLPGIRI